MDPQTTSTAVTTAAAPNGALTSISHALASTQTFILAHPIGVTFAAGAIVGMVVYAKLTKKRKA